MSDFDREAERERLREQYEKEQEKRETTEKMSELLLQGATMTNAHCSECGDPIFRYEGQEFCASCERAVDRADGAEGEDGEEGEDADDEQIEVTDPDENAQVRFGSDADSAPSDADQPEPEQRPQQPDRADGPSADQGASGGVSAARESLVRTLTRFSRQAEATEDPQRAQEHLAAAREAAEALATLRR